MSNIRKAFDHGKAFIPFITCGDPDLETTAAAVREAVKNGADLISFVAPTSEERIAKIAAEAEGFLYIISSLGVTGVRSEITTDIGAIVETARRYTDIPCAVGFGISRPDQARQMAADGVIVGSAVVKLFETYGRDAPSHVGAYVRAMKDAVREAEA